jgi:hypothetical protein
VLNKKPKKPYKSLKTILDEVFKKSTLNEYATVLIQKENEPDVSEFKVSNQTADKVRRALSSDPHEQKIASYLSTKQFTPDAFQGKGYQILLGTILESTEEEVSSLSKYIDRNDKPSLEQTPKGNYLTIGGGLGISQNLIKILFSLTDLKDPKGSNVGPGEIITALIFNDVTNSLGSGDLLLNNNPLEVKSGGRFGQQPGRGGPPIAVTSFVSPFLRTPEQLQQYTTKTSKSKFDIVDHIIASYEFITNKQAVLNQIWNILNNIYTPDLLLASKYVTEELIKKKDKIGLKNAIFKLNTEGYVKDKKLLLINEKYDYILTDKDKMVVDNGLIDSGAVKTRSNYRFNELNPNVVYK